VIFSEDQVGGEYTFADILPPDILDRAGTHAVDAFNLVRADDDVLKSTAALDKEDGIGIAALIIASASD
jgi:hypothetical protein